MNKTKGGRSVPRGLAGAETTAAEADPSTESKPAVASGAFQIVGIGASAGGLEAFAQLLGELPPDTGMAFVLIQHLDPTHTSLLAEVLSKATRMPVCPARDGETILANHVYVIPPNADIGLRGELLAVSPRNDEARKPHLPIDLFFQALAAGRGSRAIGVVLSGNASDGTEGLRAIRAADGITFAQDPASAKFDGMPRSAIDAGVVDAALTLPALAQELVRLGHHPYVAVQAEPAAAPADGARGRVFTLLRNAVGVDFSEYKAATLDRRLVRRMTLRRSESIEQYLALLQQEPEEVHALYEDLLLHVTSFFRDPEVFEALKARVFPEMMRQKAEGASVRIWVAGCSTGEEVYSIAIALLEFMGEGFRSHPIHLFGSDVAEKAVEKARLGVYSEVAMRGVSEERRRRFFSKVDAGFRIHKTVRDLCLFVRHDLARDPPFSKLDLVSCRNVLIYFDHDLQQRVADIFHFALNQPGTLLLGHAENISGSGPFFSAIDKTHKLFARNAVPSTLRFAARNDASPSPRGARGAGSRERSRRAPDLGKHLDHMLVARYSPPGVLVNERGDILQFRGETGAFLRPAPGEARNNLLKMARPGLLAGLRQLIGRAARDGAPAQLSGLEVDDGGLTRTCNLLVLPFTGLAEASEPLFVVVFEEVARTGPTGGAPRPASPDDERDEGRRISRLEHELSATREYLHSLIEDHEQASDELNAANEEFVSGNEELQSMNEELETAKEELQSTNEELTTVNEELHNRNHEINEVNSDLVNLLGTVETPILILDRAQQIRRFTPLAVAILNVRPGDIGRPLHDIRVNLAVTDLEARIREAIEGNVLHEAEVQDHAGHWYRMRIRPYTGADGRINGATLSLVDIDSLKLHLTEARQARVEAERANRAKDQFLAILSHELRTPLTTMLMHAQMLRRDDMAPRAQQAGAAIERATITQVHLIEDLLDVSRIVADKLQLVMVDTDVCAVVRAAIENAQPLATRKGVRLVVALDESIDRVSGDAPRLQQAVSNLLVNAVKFTPRGGEITVLVEGIDDHCHLTVSDTGVGIDPAFLPQVFNRFSQEDSLSTRTHGGLGLGLAIVRYLVEAHGGTVKAESEGAGKGTTVSVVLPLLVGQGPLSMARRPSGVGSTDGITPVLGPADPRMKGLRVLVVEDDPGTRGALVELFQLTGADVRGAESAAIAMAIVEESWPEVMVSDIAMPREDGYSLIRRIRARGHDRGGDLPALAFTALAGLSDRRAALDAGFQRHMVKPGDIDRLTLAVAELSPR